MNIKVITHYRKDDTTFSNDYCDVEVLVDGNLAISFGDYYHDKGKEKLQGFIEACLYFFPDVNISRSNIADRNV